MHGTTNIKHLFSVNTKFQTSTFKPHAVNSTFLCHLPRYT